MKDDRGEVGQKDELSRLRLGKEAVPSRIPGFDVGMTGRLLDLFWDGVQAEFLCLSIFKTVDQTR